MARDYDPKEIEKKWQDRWEKSRIYRAEDNFYPADGGARKPKYYTLVEFPYPSGEGLHVGHVRSYTAMDVIARKRRMEGYNVLYPIGWDAFGLPTENYAIKTGKHPALITKENTDNFRIQLKKLGLSFDWSREIDTTRPEYYKWTQWIFLKLLENGLAYKAKIPINWCRSCKIGLANEEVVDDGCERCGTPVEQKEKDQWILAITKYADRLHDDLDTVDYPERVKIQQKNWIGRSEGVLIKFDDIEIFTTRPDTIFGATFVVIAGQEDKFTGKYVTNPATKEKIPVWEALYVMSDYGTGAIMGVPADDERDMAFAKQYDLPIIKNYTPAGFEDYGKRVTKFKIRDWIFSRQRYWGEPIPVIHCEKCGIVPVPEQDLPVELPKVEKYEPGSNGESPLSNIPEFVNTPCLQCGGDAKRETDVMPNWAGSSWYFLAYLFDKGGFKNSVSIENWNSQIENFRHFMPVDWYNGGMEHTVLHLLYSRFWNKFLYDQKLVSTSEPYIKRTSHGLILAEGGEKMSKSKGNVVNPDTIVERFGADTLRLYEMFMGPFEQAIAWNEDSLVGPRRFIERVWRLQNKVSVENAKSLGILIHQTIKKVSEDIEGMKFNTAVSSLMILVNSLEKKSEISKSDFETVLLLLAPFVPHVAEELWSNLSQKNSIHVESWPTYDPEKIEVDEVYLAIQINGRVRASLSVNDEDSDDSIKAKALAMPEVKKWLDGKEPKKIIIVPRKIVSIVT